MTYTFSPGVSNNYPPAEQQLLPGVSIVIPVYNSEATLQELQHRLATVMHNLGVAFEIILINDCSQDGSWRVIYQLAERFPEVRGVNFMRNYGQHNALLCGIRLARYSAVVTLDDDLQNPPEEVPRLLKQLQDYDVAYGTPERQQHGVLRDLASTFTKLALQSAMGADIAQRTSAFRAFRTQVRDAFAAYRSSFVSIDVLLTWATTRFTAVTVRHDERKVGVSNYTLGKLIRHALNMMTGFSTLPLQLASIIGFIFTLFGIGVLLYVIGVFLAHGREVPGFAFLASIIAIFSGAQLFALGIIGEYLARMHFRSMERPIYTIREQVGEAENSYSNVRL